MSKRRRKSCAPADPRDWQSITTGPRADYVLYAEIYNDAQVGVFVDDEKLNDWLSARGMERERKARNAAAVCITDPQGRDWFLAFIPADCPVETIAHECLHLAWDILDAYGVKIDSGNHEAIAYLMQHLMRQVLRRRKAKR